MKQPTIVCCGVGVDSVGLLGRMRKRRMRPDAILFANVGSEKRQTYEFIPLLRDWLKREDFPKLTIVQYTPKLAPYRSIEGNMVKNATLPGATFKLHTCTHKFKIEPQNKWVRHWPLARAAWSYGLRIRRLIGFEAGEESRLKRADSRAHAGKTTREQELYEFQYPLMDWGMTREDCADEIIEMGLPVPPKSACYFCPNMKTHEIDSMTEEDRSRTMLIELVAGPYNQKMHGLLRRPRKSDGRPGSVTQYILQNGLPFIPLTELCRKVVLNPNCQKFAQGYTFRPPHTGPDLFELMRTAGHAVPEISTSADPGEQGLYLEDARESPPEVEAQVHDQIAELDVRSEDEMLRDYFGEMS